MKIVYLVEYPGDGGSEEYALNLAIKARDAGHEVCFVLGDATGALVERVRDENFDLRVIPMKSSFNPIAVITSVYNLRKFISDYQPDIIHTQMLREQSLVVGAKLLGSKVKLVRTFHRLDQFNGKMKPLMNIYRNYTDAFIAISDYVREYLVQNGIETKVTLIYNGVAEVFVTKKAMGLGYLGRISAEKGIGQFAHVNTGLLADTPLTIGGDGPDFNALTSFVQKNELKATLLGRVNDKSEFFSRFNVLVLPSSTEALPLVVLEAFSAGTPVVAFDLPSLRGLISDNNGALVEVGDYKSLAVKAVEIMNSKDYDKYAGGARETYEGGYTIDKMWLDTEHLYQDLSAK